MGGNGRVWELIYYYEREWKCFYIPLWEWEYGHGNKMEWDRKSHSRTSLVKTSISKGTYGHELQIIIGILDI